MDLTAEEIARYRRDGYLIYPNLFTPEEVAVLREPLARLGRVSGPTSYWEPEDEHARIVYALHERDEVYRRLCRHPRLLNPVETLLADKVHILQSRINFKPAFSSVHWNWHQDYNQWSLADKLPRPRAVLVGVFLDDVNPCNGPLMVVEGSHRFGHRPIPVQKKGLSKATIAEMATQGEIKALLGRAGTTLFLDVLTVHGSNTNMSPSGRAIFYSAYNALANTPIPSTRHPSRCGRDYRPLQPLADDCLKDECLRPVLSG